MELKEEGTRKDLKKKKQESRRGIKGSEIKKRQGGVTARP